MAKIQPGKASGGGAKPAPRPTPKPAAPAARPAPSGGAKPGGGKTGGGKPAGPTSQPAVSSQQAAMDYWARRDQFIYSLPRPTGEGPAPTPGDTTDTEYDPDRFMREYYARLDAQEKRNATETVKGLLEQYGLSSLYTTIVDYIQQGYDANTVMVLIRTTPQYKARFPAMEALAKKGRAISEAEYINYETLASGLERRYGLPESMLTGKVTDLLTNEVSMTELNDRVVLASAAAIQAPQDVKNTFSQYYGIGQGGMTAYFLDPDIATPLLEKQYASAQIGTEAARQGIGIDVYGAQNLQSLGITTEEARQGFGQVAAQRELTTGLGETLSQQQLIGANLAGDQQAQQALQRVQGSRAGAFQGGGGFAQGQGAVALGSAAR
jgi:hypothetical protein